LPNILDSVAEGTSSAVKTVISEFPLNYLPGLIARRRGRKYI
jgi:hypothetical protein